MHREDVFRLFSEEAAWPLVLYEAFWKEARTSRKLSADAKVVLSVIIDHVRSACDETGWTAFLADETLARGAGCSREVVCRAIDTLEKADLIHVERAWIDDGERHQARRYALNESWPGA